MTTQYQQREIVIEFERIRMIRKRARTRLRHCSGCGAVSDVVSHVEAAELFETAPQRLFEFIKANNCHYDISWSGKTYLCIASLLDNMSYQCDDSGPTLLCESPVATGIESGAFER